MNVLKIEGRDRSDPPSYLILDHVAAVRCARDPGGGIGGYGYSVYADLVGGGSTRVRCYWCMSYGYDITDERKQSVYEHNRWQEEQAQAFAAELADKVAAVTPTEPDAVIQ